MNSRNLIYYWQNHPASSIFPLSQRPKYCPMFGKYHTASTEIEAMPLGFSKDTFSMIEGRLSDFFEAILLSKKVVWGSLAPNK